MEIQLGFDRYFILENFPPFFFSHEWINIDHFSRNDEKEKNNYIER